MLHNILMENNDRKAEYVRSIKKQIIEVESRDVTLVCKDGGMVTVHWKLLGMSSKMLRSVLGPLGNLEMCHIFLPQFSHNTAKRLVHILTMDWVEDEVVINQELLDLLICLNIEVGEVNIVMPNQDGETYALENVIAAVSEPTTSSVPNVTPPTKFENAKTVNNAASLTTIQCGKCTKVFSEPMLEGKLRSHIGDDHYEHYSTQVTAAEVRKIFNDNTCSVCNMTFVRSGTKKGHVLFHHTDLVKIVRIEAVKSMAGHINTVDHKNVHNSIESMEDDTNELKHKDGRREGDDEDVNVENEHNFLHVHAISKDDNEDNLKSHSNINTDPTDDIDNDDDDIIEMQKTIIDELSSDSEGDNDDYVTPV